MEYAFHVVDENLSFRIIEGHTNSTGLNALLARFPGLNRYQRHEFMQELLEHGRASFDAERESENPYSVHVRYASLVP